MRKILFFAATAMLFAACTSDEVNTPKLADESPQAVAFDIYTADATRVSNGQEGVMTTTALKAENKGFGVFAVQSDNTTYDATQTTNFMWNEHVTYSSSAWTYSPIKYWPNETNVDSQSANAESHNIDVLSFFAYAPYVPEKTSTYTGELNGVNYGGFIPTASAHYTRASDEKGILAISANNDATNDPYVWYATSPIPSKSVDLLWGVAPAGGLDYKTVNPTYEHTTVSGLVAEGMPLKNLIKPAKDQKIKFLFKHALARIGVTVVAAVDQIAPGGDLAKDGKTHVAVESIKIEDVTAEKKLFTYGRLNLNNTTAGTSLWAKTSDPMNLTIDEGHELSGEIKWLGSPSETLVSGFTGVDKTERKAIRIQGMPTQAEEYFMVIPSHADTDIKVTITYYVFTADAKLDGGYAITKNVIDKTVTIPKLTNNKAYNLKLILGLTSVKLDAEVADWEVDGSTEVNLPRNNE